MISHNRHIIKLDNCRFIWLYIYACYDAKISCYIWYLFLEKCITMCIKMLQLLCFADMMHSTLYFYFYFLYTIVCASYFSKHHHIYKIYMYFKSSLSRTQLRVSRLTFTTIVSFFFYGNFAVVVMIWQASVQLLQHTAVGRKSVLTANDKSHLPAARRWNHCRGDEMWRLFRGFLRLFCKRRLQRMAGQAATCPRNELIVSRDAHMYALDWLPVRNTKVHSRELQLGEASLRALFASLIKSYDCTRYLLTSSYVTYTAESVHVITMLILGRLLFYKHLSRSLAAMLADKFWFYTYINFS